MKVVHYIKLLSAHFTPHPNHPLPTSPGRFCAGTCHAIGRVTGECNPSRTDCTCSEQTVSPRQWATCLDTGICSIYCVRKGFARGKCAGPTGWDCNCVTNKSDSGEGE